MIKDSLSLINSLAKVYAHLVSKPELSYLINQEVISVKSSVEFPDLLCYDLVSTCNV